MSVRADKNSNISVQAHRYFGLLGIGHTNIPLSKSLGVSSIKNLAKNPQEVQNVYDRVCSDIISNISEGSVTRTHLGNLFFIEGNMNGLMMRV